jgi:uncharacterized membrane protein YjjP (DUF1212 family)
MKLLFIFLVFIHGIIHIMGFVKAFSIVEISQLTQNISKLAGVLWLLTFLLFILAASLVLLNSTGWWMPTIIAVVTSQILIVCSWHDAKYGTIPNIIILIVVILAIASWNFNKL